MVRRRVLAVSAALAAAFAVPLAAQADTWPSKPITLIVPFAPGGATDIVGRLIGDQLSQVLKQSVVVENRAGAAGTLGMAQLARSEPDGYTYAMLTDSIPIQPLLNDSLTWSMDNFQAIAKVATSPEVMVVNAEMPAKTVKELVQLAKSKPGELSFAASSTGSVHHLAGEVFKQQTGIDMIHIPYKGGGQSIVDLVAGRVDVGFIGLAPVLSQIKNGQLKALALTGAERNPQAPDIPTFTEAGYGDFNVELWVGMVGQKGAPAETVERMRQAVIDILATPAVQAKLQEIGFKPVTDDQKNFGPWLKEQQQGWQAVIKQIGMK